MTKFSGISLNNAPALTDTLIGVTAGNADDRVTIQNLINLFFNNIPNNSIPAAALATNAITLGYAQITAGIQNSSGTPVGIPGLSVAVTIPAGTRRVKITAWVHDLWMVSSTADVYMSIWDGAVGSGTKLSEVPGFQNGGQPGAIAMAVVQPPAGSKTYSIGIQSNGTNAANFGANATYPAFILVETI